jgi:hypothetical protein
MDFIPGTWDQPHGQLVAGEVNQHNQLEMRMPQIGPVFAWSHPPYRPTGILHDSQLLRQVIN